jgi:hypothetical protein
MTPGGKRTLGVLFYPEGTGTYVEGCSMTFHEHPFSTWRTRRGDGGAYMLPDDAYAGDSGARVRHGTRHSIATAVWDAESSEAFAVSATRSAEVERPRRRPIRTKPSPCVIEGESSPTTPLRHLEHHPPRPLSTPFHPLRRLNSPSCNPGRPPR